MNRPDESGLETVDGRTIDRRNGRFRSTVTDLEMRAPPGRPAPAPPRPRVRVERWEQPDVDAYLRLFRRVGDRWLWFGRLAQGRDAVAALLRSPQHAVWRLWADAAAAGLCELDRSRPGEVEIAYFGLVPDCIGAGLGGYFMRAMLAEAWRGDVRRVWLHTCTEDHPGALDYYRHMGFRPCGQRTEWVHDPRLRGLVPRTAGPHVPIPE